MSEKPVHPLRRRVLEDMAMRKFKETTRRHYLSAVKNLAVFFGRSPETATPDAGGKLKFFGNDGALAQPQAFAAFLAPLRKTRWFVYAKRPFAGPKAVLAYLSRYTHRAAISNRRLIESEAHDCPAKNDPSGTMRNALGLTPVAEDA